MVESTHVTTLDQFLTEVADHKGKVFRGQSTDYPTVTPSLFRRREPLDLAPLLKAADDLYIKAHKVVEERRCRGLTERMVGPAERVVWQEATSDTAPA